MKKYYSIFTKLLAIMSALPWTLFVASIIFILVPGDDYILHLVLMFFFASLGLLLILLSLLYRIKRVEIDNECVVFCGAIVYINGKRVSGKTIIRFSEIASIGEMDYEDEEIYAIEDNLLVVFVMYDGAEISVRLLGYREKTLKEILCKIRENTIMAHLSFNN